MSLILAWSIVIVFLLATLSLLIYQWIKQYKESSQTRKYVEVKDDSSEENITSPPVFSYSKYIKTKHPYNHLITSKNKKFLNKLDYWLYWGRYAKLRDNATEMILHPTKAEYILYVYLNKQKIDFIPQCICVTEHWYIMDCYLPKYHINIELDGDYHFTNEQSKKNWKRSQEICKTYGIKTYRFTNNQIINFMFVEKLNKLIK